MRTSFRFANSKFLSGALLAAAFAFTSLPAMAGSPPEDYISSNVNRGLQILNNSSISKDQRMTQFRSFLLTLSGNATLSATLIWGKSA